MTALSVSEAAATVRSAFVFARQAAAEHPEMGYRADHFDLSALDLLIERAERAASLEARMAYIASEYDCYCETPGTSNDCAVCECRAAFAAGSEGERIVCAACGGKWDDQTTSCEECGGQTATVKGE